MRSSLNGGILSVALLLSFSVHSCPEPISVVALLPLNSEVSSFGTPFLDGMLSASVDDLDVTATDVSCEVDITYLDTTDESVSFVTQWYSALEMEPDYLIGPLLKHNQQQLIDMDRVELPTRESIGYWLYPGEFSKLTISKLNSRKLNSRKQDGSLPQLYQFSIGNNEKIRNVLSYGWEQGLHNISVILPNSEFGSGMAEEMRELWEEMGGVVLAESHYGERYSNFGKLVEDLLKVSDAEGGLDGLFIFADEARLQMIVPLLNYYGRSEPVFSVSAPLADGLSESERLDLNSIIYPQQPSLVGEYRVDDLLLQIENIGFDMVNLIREEKFGELQQGEFYQGRAGGYVVEGERLERELCMVQQQRSARVILQCPSLER